MHFCLYGTKLKACSPARVGYPSNVPKHKMLHSISLLFMRSATDPRPPSQQPLTYLRILHPTKITTHDPK